MIELTRASKWYGQVLGLSDVTLRLEGGIVGLLGPNGAGKSTLMKLAAGLLRPSRGSVTLFGQPVWSSPEARRRLGYCPEHEGIYESLSGLEMVAAMAELSGLPRGEAGRRAEAALADVGLEHDMGRRLAGYSRGMRQRVKLAQAFVHDPDILLLDEPLTGCDPLARARIIARMVKLGAAGKSILMSSHVLHEIEAVTKEVVVIYRGQVLAEGNIYRLRELIDRHPHRVRVECERPRALASLAVGAEHVARVEVVDGALEIETRVPDQLYDALPAMAAEAGVTIRTLTSPDDNIEALFDYLTRRGP